ncbi:unnamed protein product [Camellia sinensis]
MFLEVLNLSNNQLAGPIPQGSQFNTFGNDSYGGNLALCGFPLSKKCKELQPLPPPQTLQQYENSDKSSRFNWQVVVLGYGCGFVFGMVMGYLMFITQRPEWFMKIVEGKHHKKVKRSKKGAHGCCERRNQQRQMALSGQKGKTKSQEEFVSIVEEVADMIGGFIIVDMYPSVKLFQVSSGIRGTLKKMHKRIDQILENIVNEHRERKRITESGKGEEEDLVDVLLRIQKHGGLEFPLTDNNIKAVILRHFQCGKRDIINNRRSGNVRNAENPQVMKRAQAKVRRVFDKKGNVNETCLHELKYLNLVIKETLRLHTSAPLLVPRESGEQCTINGYDIPAKTKVIVNAWAIGQDPKYWNEAEKFDPERFLDSEIDFKGRDFEFTPFGAGRRICPGISFAIPNIELPLAQLLYHFDWKLPDGKKYEELDIEEDLGLIVRRKNYLILIPIPYYQILFFLLSKNRENIC